MINKDLMPIRVTMILCILILLGAPQMVLFALLTAADAQQLVQQEAFA